MEKVYKANLQFNTVRKRNSLILISLFFISMLGMVSLFVALKEYMVAILFGCFIFMPIGLLPQIFKNYPTDGRAILTITDKDVTVGKETYKLKDVTKFRVIITLPASKLDSENYKTLQTARDEKPSYEYMGNLDIVVKDASGKAKVLYTTIDDVIDASETLIYLGIKNYEIKYSIKKLTMLSEYDLARDVMLKKARESKQTIKQESPKGDQKTKASIKDLL